MKRSYFISNTILSSFEYNIIHQIKKMIGGLVDKTGDHLKQAHQYRIRMTKKCQGMINFVQSKNLKYSYVKCYQILMLEVKFDIKWCKS